jgi:hypothetical protein
MPTASLKAHVETFAAALSALPGAPDCEACLADLRALGERVAARPRDLTYVLLFGPTGCGKSKIANSLFGRLLTPVGYRRPTTETPSIIVPHGASPGVLESLPVLPFELVELDGEGFARLVLIDAPDIDSVREEHRSIAEAFLRLADAVAVVLDPIKYADESIWRYLRRFERERITYAILLNKVEDPVVPADLASKLRSEGITAAVLTLPYQPSLDHELLGESEGLRSLRATLTGWAGSEAVRREALRRTAAAALTRLTAQILPGLAHHRAALEALANELERITAASVETLHRVVPFNLDRATLATMYARVLAKLERIDPLRVPRRFLSYPIRLVREKLGLTRRERPPADELEDLWDLREEAFLSVALRLADEIEEASGSRGLALPASMTESALREAFRALRVDFERWVTKSAEELASTLTVGQRVRFYVAQTLVIGALIGVELHTGGMLTVTEAVTGGLVSPFAAKLIGMALSAEESNRFQEKARRAYLDEVAALLRRQAGPFVEGVHERIGRVEHVRREASALVRELENIAGGSA